MTINRFKRAEPPRRLRTLLLLAGALLTLAACGRQDAQLPDFSELVEENSPSVVNIQTISKLPAMEGDPQGDPRMEEFFQDFFGFGPGTGPEGELPEALPNNNAGSGFVISRDGLVLTNEHVVQGASEIWVRFDDGRELPATLIGSDPRGDIALLRVEKGKFRPVRLGKSEHVRPGQWAMAIGAPFGFEQTVTAGVISAMGRALPTMENETYVPFIQSDVAINPGNSGGPLFNLEGEVIGVNAQIFTETGSYNGLSFAIPIDYAMEVVEQLLEHGSVRRGFLGVRIQDVDRELAEALGLGRIKGALVTAILPDSPAEAAGLQSGDVILSVDRHPVSGSGALPQIIGRYPPDRRVALEVLRDRKRLSIPLVLGTLPEQPQALTEPPGQAPGQPPAAPEQDSMLDQIGLAVQEGPEGLVVQAIRRDSVVESLDIRPADLIISIASEELTSIEALEKALRAADPGTRLPLRIRRDGQDHFVALPVPDEQT
ncbi:MAG: Do family serine endopeptidase [Halothiobacillaceae bacterium]